MAFIAGIVATTSPAPPPLSPRARRTPWCRAGRRGRRCAIAGSRWSFPARARSGLRRWVRLSALRRSPSQASSIATEPISDAGLALSWPSMSGAEPCCACATPCSSPWLIEAARPRLPAISEASSDRMSPNALVVTITSKRLASRTSSAAIASMICSSTCDLRIARRDRARAFQEQPVGHAQHVGLVHHGHLLARPLHRQLEAGFGDPRRALRG